MAGLKQGTLYLTDLPSSPSNVPEGKKVLYVYNNSVYTKDSSGNINQLDGGGPGGSISVKNGNTTISNVTTIELSGSAVTSLQDLGGGTVVFTINASGGGSGGTVWGVTSITGNAFTPNESSNAFSYTLNNHATLYCPTTMQNGESKTIKIIQASPSVYSLSFANSPPYVWKFSNGNPPVITSTAGAIDILTILRLDNDVYVTIIKNFLEST